MISKYRSYYILIVAAIVIAVTMCFCLISFSNMDYVSAFTSSNISAAEDIGDILLEKYENRGDGKVFDGEIMQALYSSITGVEGADIANIDSILDVDGEITAATIRDNNEGQDIVLTMDGQQWTVTHLTKDSLGNTIATLWQADRETTHRWNIWDYNGTTIEYPSNVYGTSYIRSHGLNIGSDYVASKGAESLTQSPQSETHEYAKLTMPDVKGSLTDFIVKPSAVAYQGTENNMAGGTIGNVGYTLPNEAYGTPSGTIKWYNTNSVLPTKAGYDAWKDDYIWLPSLTETGYNESVNGIWALSNNQRSNTTSFWLRSGYYSYSNSAYSLRKDGNTCGGGIVSSSYAFRPALHLNLTSAAAHSGGLALAEPTDVTAMYKGTALDLTDVSAEQKTWYDASSIDISYATASMTDVGEYTCTATVKPNLAADGLTFSGTPGAGESATTRKFKFKIGKKKITPVLALDVNDMPTVTSPGAIYSGDTQANGRAPNISFTYESIDGKGYNSALPPTAIGKYKAIAVIDNNCPYEIDGEVSIEFELSKRRVVKPSIAGAVSAQYNGAAQVFQLSNVADSDVTVSAPSGATYDSAAHTVSVKDAGKYKIRIELRDSATTQWSDGKSAGYDLEIEITKKPLKVEITAPTSWNYGTEGVITIVGDCLTGDRTELYIYCVKGVGSGIDPDAQEIDLDKYKTYSGDDYRTRIITIPADFAEGDYTLFVRMSAKNSFANQNGNYELSAQTKSAPFTVAGKEVTFTANDVKWQYVNDGATTQIGNGLQTVKLTYNGKPYSFSIDTGELESKGVRVKTENGGGYSGDTVMTDAGAVAYTVTVYLTSITGYEQKDLSFTLTYEIGKAKYDLSGLSWNYTSAIEYDGQEHNVTLSGAIPNGLTASYSGNGNTGVGSYTTSVSFALAEAYRSNYILPERNKSDSYIGDFEWSVDWEIAKAELIAEWKVGGNGNTVTLPKLKPTDKLTNSMVEYVFYATDADGNIDRSKVVGEQEVLDSGTGNKEIFYYVEVSLKDEYKGNYTLKFASDTDNPYKFSVGENKSVIKLVAKIDGELLKAKYPYRGSPYAVTVEITVNEGNVPQELIIIEYYSGDTKLSGAPADVGEYRVVISLKDADSAYVDADCDEYHFEIEKADFDVSGLKWTTQAGGATVSYDAAQGKWLDESGSEYAFIYDGLEHTVTLSGLDAIAGLSATVSGNKVKNAGSYIVSVTFTYDEGNYNAPVFPASVALTIGKKLVDTKEMKWGYTAGGSDSVKPYASDLVYTRSGGNAVVYTMKLMGVPRELSDHITYPAESGVIRAASVVGNYTAKFAVAAEAYDNYDFVLPASLTYAIDWEITKRVIKSPVFDGSWTVFDGKTHDLSKLCQLADGWENYITLTAKLDGVGLDDYTAAYDAGVYTVSFELIIVDGAKPNVEWQSQTVPVVINVDKYYVYIDGWTDGGKDSATSPDLASLPSFFEYVYTDLQGNPVTEHTVDNTYSTAFIKKAVVKAEYAANVTLDGEITHEFVTDAAPDTPVTYVNKPTLGIDKLTFDGQSHTIADFKLEGFDAAVMDIVLSQQSVRDVGVYKAVIKFKSGINYSWTMGDGTVDRSSVELEYSIVTLELVKPIDGGKLYYNGMEQTYLPQGADSNFVDYRDNVEIVRGSYIATASLKDKVNTCWDDGSVGDVTFTWEIVKGIVSAPHITSPESVVYNGEDYSLLELIDGYDAALISIEGDLIGRDAGDYSFTVRLIDSDNYEWDNAADGQSFTWTILKAKIEQNWDMTGDTPRIAVPDEYEGLVEFYYTYYDEDGNEAAEDALEQGKKYKVVATLAAEYENNFEFVDAYGNALDVPYESEPKEFCKTDVSSRVDVPFKWDEGKNPPELILPDSVKDILHPVYEYKDKDGNAVSKDDLREGEEYTVTVKIPDAEKGLVNFKDADGNILDINNLPPYTFTKQAASSGGSNGSNGAGGDSQGGITSSDWYKKLLIGLTVVVSIMTLIILLIVILFAAYIRRDRERTKLLEELAEDIKSVKNSYKDRADL